MALENLSFKGGCDVKDYKSLTNKKPLENGPVPETVRIHLSQHTGQICKPLVKLNDEVKVGQKIGEADAFISSPVHSSVSGKVVKIEDVLKADGTYSQAVVIENDGLDTLAYEEKNNDYKSMSEDEIIELVKEAGIVGLGGAAFPSYVKLRKRTPEQVTNTIVINAAECEPYLTADQMMMENYPREVFLGTDVIIHCMGAKEGIIGVEDNKPEAIQALKEVEKDFPHIKVAVLKTKYPQGDQRRLIESTTGLKLATSVSGTTKGIQVFNVSTAQAIYEAVVKEKPLYEKIITVTGDALKEPKNLLCKVGTNIQEILAYCGGFSEDPGRIVLGGPMMGDSIFDIDQPTVKALGGIIVMTKEQAELRTTEDPCIRCGKCLNVCPVFLMPLKIQQYSLVGKYDEAKKLNIMDCIECGSCSYICPSNRPLVDAIVFGKNQIYLQDSKDRN